MKLIAHDYDLRGQRIGHRVVDLDLRQFTPAQHDHLIKGIGVTTVSRRGRTDYQPSNTGADQ